MERSASGRRGVEADEVRAGEVRPLHNSIEADEQTWATGGGVGGAKGEDRGKHRRATHVPDIAPDKRVPEARLCTRSCSWDSSLTTRGGSPVRESRPPGSVRGASSNGCPYPDRTALRTIEPFVPKTQKRAFWCGKVLVHSNCTSAGTNRGDHRIRNIKHV